MDRTVSPFVERLPLATPVKLGNGVLAAICAHNPCDGSRYQVAWWDSHYWRSRRTWCSRVQFEVIGVASSATDESAALSA